MAHDPDRPVSSGRDSSARRGGFRLVHRGREIPLESGEYVIGRAPGSDVLVEDPLVSRRHARLLVNDTTALLEDLQSENGVFVNEQRIRRSVRLSDGDRILLGSEEIVFVAGAEAERPSGTVEVVSTSSARFRTLKKMADGAPSTLEADAFEYLGQIAERMIRANRGKTAERLLRGHLDEVLTAARAGESVARDVVDAASLNALKLAVAVGRGVFVDFVIELHLLRKIPPSIPVTAELRTVLGKVPQIDRAAWEAYERLMKIMMPTMSPTDQSRARSFLWIEKE